MKTKSDASNASRDRFCLTRDQLMADYASISSKRRGAAEASSIRNQSSQYLNILAYEGTKGHMEFAELKESVREFLSGSAGLPSLVPIVGAEIGRVLVLHPRADDDRTIGRMLLESTVPQLSADGKSRRFRLLLIQDYILEREFEKARALLDQWIDIDKIENGYLRSEMLHPFIARDNGDSQRWLANFNQAFKKQGLVPIALEEGTGTLFDRIIPARKPSLKPETIVDNPASPVVSVVVTAYKPSLIELTTSVNSLLRQTLQDIEIIVVNDCSGAEYDSTFERIGTLDSRVRVVSMAKNSGTYASRNMGFKLARGEFVAGQDDDDWSHPQRIETQVNFLRDNPKAAGCRVYGLTCGPDLERIRRGYYARASNASSLMVRNTTMAAAGGFLDARKAADTELALRVEQLTGAKIEDIRKPLTIVRILPDSLSRSEFGAGWSHPARRQFKSAYSCWHSSVSQSELSISGHTSAKVHIPRRFRIEAGYAPEQFDVVLAGDWRQYGGPQKSMIEEIKALNSAGYRVAILHLEAPRFMSTASKPMNSRIQSLINEGVVDEVLYDDDVAVKLLVLRYPPILQFAPDQPSGLHIDKMFILANQAPSEEDGSDIRYLVRDCHENAVRNFATDVSWVPQGPLVREAILPYLSTDEIQEFDLPGIVDPVEWSDSIPRSPRSQIPVVGRHSRDNSMKWPDDPKTMELVYPTNGLFDIRVMGGSSAAERVLRQSSPPAGWTVFPTDAFEVGAFLRSLDFYVFYQHSIATEAFGRAILEAIAANLVVILPPHYRDVFKEAAIYAHPEDVIRIVRDLHSNRELYQNQQEKARVVLNREFTHRAYANKITEVLNSTSAGSMIGV